MGRDPAGCLIPSADVPNSLFVAEDVDEAWASIGPHLLHDAQAYGTWMGADHEAVSRSHATTVDDLRAESGNYRILTVDEAVELVRTTGFLSLQPLCGGLDPDRAWTSLRLIAEEVLPAV